MKKFAIVFLVCISTLLLAACGGDTAAEPEAIVSQPEVSANAAVPPMSTAAPNANAPAQENSQKADSAKLKATAKEYVGQPVEELFAAIGEPISADYASSCLGPGEDGELVYDGFVVYSYKENGSEVVQSVE